MIDLCKLKSNHGARQCRCWAVETVVEFIYVRCDQWRARHTLRRGVSPLFRARQNASGGVISPVWDLHVVRGTRFRGI